MKKWVKHTKPKDHMNQHGILNAWANLDEELHYMNPGNFQCRGEEADERNPYFGCWDLDCWFIHRSIFQQRKWGGQACTL